MKRMMIVHILCAGLLMLSVESQGAGAGKPVPKKKVVAKKKKSAAAGAAIKPKKKVAKKTPAAVQAKPKVKPAVGAGPGVGAGVPKVPAVPGGELESFFAEIVKGDLRVINERIINNPSLLTMTDKEGNNALIVASRAGKNDVVLRLLFSDSIKRNINKTNKQGHDALYYANPEIAELLLKEGARPPLPAGLPPTEEKKKIAAGVGAGSPPPIPAWQEEKKKEAVGAGAPPIPAWIITDPNHPINVALKKAVHDYYSHLAGTEEMRKKMRDAIISLLESGADITMLDKISQQRVLYLLLWKEKHDLFLKNIRNDKQLFRQLLFYILDNKYAGRRFGWKQLYALLDSFIESYKKAGGSLENSLSLLDEWAYNQLKTKMSEDVLLDEVREAAKIMIKHGATLGKPREFREMGHAKPEILSNPAMRATIEDVVQQYKEERRAKIGEGAGAAGLPSGIAGIIAEYEGSKAPTETKTKGFEVEESPAVAAGAGAGPGAGAPQLGSGMGLGIDAPEATSIPDVE